MAEADDPDSPLIFVDREQEEVLADKLLMHDELDVGSLLGQGGSAGVGCRKTSSGLTGQVSSLQPL